MDIGEIAVSSLSNAWAKAKTVGRRMALVILIVTGIIVTDNYFGFSYHYDMEKKVETIDKIETMLASNKIDSVTKIKIKRIESEVINHQDFFSLLWSFSSLAISRNNSINKYTTSPISASPIFDRDYLLQVISSTWALFLFYLYVVVANSTQPVFTYRNLATILITGFSLAALGSILSGLFGLIPLINGNVYWNYLLNTVLQIAITASIMVLISYAFIINKKKRQVFREIAKAQAKSIVDDLFTKDKSDN